MEIKMCTFRTVGKACSVHINQLEKYADSLIIFYFGDVYGTAILFYMNNICFIGTICTSLFEIYYAPSLPMSPSFHLWE